MKLIPFITGLLINSAAAQIQLRGSNDVTETHNVKRQLVTSTVLMEPTHSTMTGLKATTNNKYLIGHPANGLIYFYNDFNRFNELEIQYQKETDEGESIRKVKIFDVYNNKYLCTYDEQSGHYVRLGNNCGNDEIFWEYNIGNDEFAYQSETQHIDITYYNDQWFREKTVNGNEILSLQGGSVFTTFTKTVIEASTYNLEVENAEQKKLFIEVSCRHKDDTSIEKPGTTTVTKRWDWNAGMDKTETHEFLLERCEDYLDSDYQAFVKASRNARREYDVKICPGMYGLNGDSKGCTKDWVKLREVYGTSRLIFNQRSDWGGEHRLYFKS